MVVRDRRLNPRTEFLIGLMVVLVGVLISVVGVAVDTGGVLTTGLVVLALGMLATLGVILPKRNDGTRIWQTEQGKAI
jgi:hypothetical protein